MVERIKKVLEFYNLSAAAFADQIGINRSNVTHLFSGRNQPSLELAKKILLTFPDIKTEWLILGVGEMLHNDADKELTFKIQNEKKQQNEASELNLFSIFPERTNNNTVESKENEFRDREEKIKQDFKVQHEANSISEIIVEKKSPPPASNSNINRIVFFYSDQSFEVYHPGSQKS